MDDVIDAERAREVERIAFAGQQKSLLESCYRGETPANLCDEEWMLVDLIHNDTEKNSGS